VRVDAGAFVSASVSQDVAPFKEAPLTLTAVQWSSQLNAAVAVVPIQRAQVCD
jgi:hypothetical protein